MADLLLAENLADVLTEEEHVADDKLYSAVESVNVREVETLLEQGHNPDGHDDASRPAPTPLMIAVTFFSTEALDGRMFGAGGDAHFKSDESLRSEMVKIIHLLLDAGADPTCGAAVSALEIAERTEDFEGSRHESREQFESRQKLRADIATQLRNPAATRRGNRCSRPGSCLAEGGPTAKYRSYRNNRTYKIIAFIFVGALANAARAAWTNLVVEPRRYRECWDRFEAINSDMKYSCKNYDFLGSDYDFIASFCALGVATIPFVLATFVCGKRGEDAACHDVWPVRAPGTGRSKKPVRFSYLCCRYVKVSHTTPYTAQDQRSLFFKHRRRGATYLELTPGEAIKGGARLTKEDDDKVGVVCDTLQVISGNFAKGAWLQMEEELVYLSAEDFHGSGEENLFWNQGACCCPCRFICAANCCCFINKCSPHTQMRIPPEDFLTEEELAGSWAAKSWPTWLRVGVPVCIRGRSMRRMDGDEFYMYRSALFSRLVKDDENQSLIRLAEELELTPVGIDFYEDPVDPAAWHNIYGVLYKLEYAYFESHGRSFGVQIAPHIFQVSARILLENGKTLAIDDQSSDGSDRWSNHKLLLPGGFKRSLQNLTQPEEAELTSHPWLASCWATWLKLGEPARLADGRLGIVCSMRDSDIDQHHQQHIHLVLQDGSITDKVSAASVAQPSEDECTANPWLLDWRRPTNRWIACGGRGSWKGKSRRKIRRRSLFSESQLKSERISRILGDVDGDEAKLPHLEYWAYRDNAIYKGLVLGLLVGGPMVAKTYREHMYLFHERNDCFHRIYYEQQERYTQSQYDECLNQSEYDKSTLVLFAYLGATTFAGVALVFATLCCGVRGAQPDEAFDLDQDLVCESLWPVKPKGPDWKECCPDARWVVFSLTGCGKFYGRWFCCSREPCGRQLTDEGDFFRDHFEVSRYCFCDPCVLCYRRCKGTQQATENQALDGSVDSVVPRRKWIACCGTGSCKAEGGPTAEYLRFRKTRCCALLVTVQILVLGLDIWLQTAYWAAAEDQIQWNMVHDRCARENNCFSSDCCNTVCGCPLSYLEFARRNAVLGIPADNDTVHTVGLLSAFPGFLLLLATCCCGAIDEPDVPYTAGTVAWCWSNCWPVRKPKRKPTIPLQVEALDASDNSSYVPPLMDTSLDGSAEIGSTNSTSVDAPPVMTMDAGTEERVENPVTSGSASPTNHRPGVVNQPRTLSLSEFCEEHKFTAFESALEDLGVAVPSELVDVTNEELEHIGFNPIQLKRLRRETPT
eukprot:COSAG02_NODE_1686_length_11319_cov_78.896702_2_plen_1262_part_00